MSLDALVSEILQKVKSGEFVGYSDVQIANAKNYDAFAVLDAFGVIRKKGLAAFREVGVGDLEIMGLTEKGENFLDNR